MLEFAFVNYASRSDRRKGKLKYNNPFLGNSNAYFDPDDHLDDDDGEVGRNLPEKACGLSVCCVGQVLDYGGGGGWRGDPRLAGPQCSSSPAQTRLLPRHSTDRLLNSPNKLRHNSNFDNSFKMIFGLQKSNGY